MRCEDCLPLIEDYFDGEVKGRNEELMASHLAACETCAAALDALSFEQEIYTRYDRGLEVTPALWARVSAEIAREPLPASREPKRPFLSRLREGFAAALVALAARPALASSLALLVVGVTAGSLWLANKKPTDAPAQVAVNVPGRSAVNNPPSVVKNNDANVPAAMTPDKVMESGDPDAVEPYRDDSRKHSPEEYAAGQRTRVTRAGGAREIDVATLLADAPAAAANPNIVVFKADEHATAPDDASILVNAALSNASAVSVVTSDARLLDPEEKDVARHVEQTQMLLRSFQNSRTADDTNTVNVAYERKLSRKLLAENATLRLDAETRGDKDTRQVLDSIEPFLLDIANLREQPSREEVRSIKERVTKNEIIAALQVY
jgi:hypothetical protein